MTLYMPREDSFLLKKHVKKHAEGLVLDMGTGTGIQALSVYGKVKGAIALDINPEAVEIVRKSIEKGGIKNMLVYESDLFSALDDKKGEITGKFGMGELKFDTIIFNPPYLPADDMEDEDTATCTTGGREGHEILGMFFAEAPNYLKPEGKILIVFSSLTGKKEVDGILKRNNLKHEQVDNEKLFFEELYVYVIEKVDKKNE